MPASIQHKALLTAFWPGRPDRCAIVSKDVDFQRMRVYDTKSGHVVIDYNAENNEQFTCLRWGQIKQQGKSSNGLVRVIVLGTQSGSILFYSTVTKSIIKRLQGTKPVTDFVLTKDGTIGYAATNELFVTQWNLETESVQRVWLEDTQETTKLVLDHDDTLMATAGKDIHLWDIKTNKVLKKYTGHSDVVTKMLFTKDDKHLVSIAEGDVHVHVWNTSLQNQDVTDLAGLVMSEPAIDVDVSGTGTILAVSVDGRLGLWENPVSEDAPVIVTRSAKRTPSAIIRVVTKDSEKNAVPLLAAVFGNKDEVAFGRGSGLTPQFENVSYRDSDGNIVPETVLTRSSIITIDSISLPSTPSNQSLLILALKANDTDHINRCLVPEPEMIRANVMQLPTAQVVPLVHHLMNRLKTSCSKNLVVIMWFKTVLLVHSAYLMTKPALVTSLAGIHKNLGSAERFPKTLALQGRLGLIQSQIDARTRQIWNTENDDDDVLEQSESESESEEEEEEEEEEDDMLDLVGDADAMEEVCAY
ncbi:WD40-repeat-containing domain protein [Phycomyces blakesleeanus]|uniref:WD40-repeat-containing domain protein n=1 Tax=Phycomyces blakesleeanus TaxID=4837 RepID=A0ABR3AXX0_PHYBL